MMEPSFAKLLVRLAEAEIRFVLVGGIAVALNGYLRVTEDVDILVDSSPENIRQLLDCLSEFGEGFASELEIADFEEEEGAIRIIEDTEDCVIDIFTIMSGLRYPDLMEEAVPHEVEGRVINHASRSSLIRLKSGSVREKDQLDVLALKKLEDDPNAFQ